MNDFNPLSKDSEPFWLYIACVSMKSNAEPKILNKAAYFLSDLNVLSPLFVPKEEPTRTLRSLGLDETVIAELKKKGEAHKTWITRDDNGRLYQRPIQFFYTLRKVAHADMLRAKDI